jgi:hypothetical protein
MERPFRIGTCFRLERRRVSPWSKTELNMIATPVSRIASATFSTESREQSAPSQRSGKTREGITTAAWRSVLYGVRLHDLATFAFVPLFLAGIASLACWIPSRRAARVDPLTALRHE